MTAPFARDEGGQALVVVALAGMVLVGALALSVDWGYGLAVRRATQNEADAAALATARLVAATYLGAAAGFGANQSDAWCEAARASAENAGGRATSGTSSLAVSFSDDGTSWTTVSSVGDCADTSGGDPVPATSRFVRVSVAGTYAALFTAFTRAPVSVAASARAELAAGTSVMQLQLPAGASEVAGAGLSGSTTEPNAAIWPLLRHFDAQEFNGAPCGTSCDPNDPRSPSPIRVWPNAGGDAFTTLVTLGHDSVRLGASPKTHQLLTESDYRGSSEGDQAHPLEPPFANMSAQAECPGPTWDTAGTPSDDLALATAATCDVPNWFYYGYGGGLGIGTDWWGPSWGPDYRIAGVATCQDPTAAACPSALPIARSSCTSVAAYFPVASCTQSTSLYAPSGTSTTGDWIETLSSQTLSVNMASRMREFIARYGRTTPYSAEITPAGVPYGRAVVIRVFLWDCGEQLVSGQFQLVLGNGGDCARMDAADADRIDRVHAFTVVPLTFYEGLVSTSPSVSVKAYWGDAIGDPGTCSWDPESPACALNPLINSAFLVADGD